MRDQAHWDDRYRRRDLPWDTGRHDRHLAEALARLPTRPSRVLEIGCGNGNNAAWLAEQGYLVTGIDVSPVAIAQATNRIGAAGLQADLVAADVVGDPIPNGPFDFVFDRGCFHSFDGSVERGRYAQTVHRCLGGDGFWFSLVGSADAPPREIGPPRLRVEEIATAVEPCFEILEIMATHFDSDQPDPPPAWACLMRARRGIAAHAP